ncbi:MAG: PcfJ domain-containing protein [Treponema sp.]|nr:PcfJ domain-containing protein [Treponema sp.]
MFDYFYRLINSCEFKHFSQVQNIIPYRCKTPFRSGASYYSQSSKEWLSINDEKEISALNQNSLLEEFVETPINHNFFEEEEDPVTFYLLSQSDSDYTLYGLEGFLASDLVRYKNHLEDLKIQNFNKKNITDSNKFYKDFFGVIVQTQEEDLTLKITIQKFKRSGDVYSKEELQDFDINPCVEEASVLFDLKNGQVEIQAPWGVSEYSDFYLDNPGEQLIDFDKACSFFDYLSKDKIPGQIINFAFEKFISLAQAFTGIKYDLNHFDKEDNSLVLMYKITKIPFEPNLYPIIISPQITGRGIKFKYDRKDPKIFAKFCSKAGIRNTKIIRRAYFNSNETLINYLLFKDCGFKDINYLGKILESDFLLSYINHLDQDSLLFFMRYCIEKRGQKPALKLLYKASEDYLFSSDAMEMFTRYFRNIPKNLKKNILKDGLTEFNHNALANISYQCHHENEVFSYNNKQLKLQDKIGAYEFLLPKDSYQLCDIGACLHNCVASYVSKIVEGQSTIVYVKKGNEYKICIEIRENVVKQELVVYNQKPSKEEIKVLDEWHSRHNLKVE